MADDDDPQQPAKPQPSPNLSDGALAEVSELIDRLRGLIPSPATKEIDRVDSGLFSPPSPPPTAPDADQTGGVGRGRHPAGEKPVPSVAEILRDPKRYHPPTPPGHGHGRGPKR